MTNRNQRKLFLHLTVLQQNCSKEEDNYKRTEQRRGGWSEGHQGNGEVALFCLVRQDILRGSRLGLERVKTRTGVAL